MYISIRLSTRYTDQYISPFLHAISFSFFLFSSLRLILLSLFYHYCLHLHCYFHDVSADMYSDLLQVFVELGNLHGTLNYVLYWIHRVPCSDSVSHNRVQVLSFPESLLACSQGWTCNLQIIVSFEASGINAYKRCGNSNKDEVNTPKTLNDKNHLASSQKFWQIILLSLPMQTDVFVFIYVLSYLPTPLLGQDITRGQIWSGV